MILTFLLFYISQVNAKNKTIIDCMQGFCTEIKIIRKQIIKSRPKENIYLVDMNFNGSGVNQVKHWVQCSTSEPFIAFIPREYNERNEALIKLLNPGSESFSMAQRIYHRIYWAVCHNIWKENIYEMAETAKSFGYPLTLPDYQVEVPKSVLSSCLPKHNCLSKVIR
jgi:hypothetical protein